MAVREVALEKAAFALEAQTPELGACRPAPSVSAASPVTPRRSKGTNGHQRSRALHASVLAIDLVDGYVIARREMDGHYADVILLGGP